MGYNSYTPNIHCFIILLLLDDFWSHVKRGTEYLAKHAFRSIEASEAEIGQFQIELARLRALLRAEQNVFGLDVPMGNVLFMHVIKCE